MPGATPEPAAPSSPAAPYACIAAGGTGGHVVPGIAIARALVARGHEADSIFFLGSVGRIETTLVPEAGFELVALPGRGIERKVSLAAISAILGIIRGVVKGFGVIRRRRPRVLVLLGGYASVPAIVAGVVLRIPMVVVARDARVGAADRLGARFAKVCAVPFADSDLPAGKVVVTGNPVRAEVLDIDRARDQAAARAVLGLPADRVTIGVFTGSLGSQRVNDAVRELVVRWADRSDLAVRHVIGTRDWDAVAATLPDMPADGLVYQAVRYEDHMDQLLAASDVVVSRAGGATVAELAVVGLPAILVPLPIATKDHQTFNAEALVAVGGGVRVPDAELDADRLERELAPLLADPARRDAMGRAAQTIGHRDAADRVAALVEEHARA